MELTKEMIEQLKADLAKAKNYEDLMGRDGCPYSKLHLW